MAIDADTAARLRAFMADPNVPSEAKQAALAKVRAMPVGDTSTSTTTTPAEPSFGQKIQRGGQAVGDAITRGVTELVHDPAQAARDVGGAVVRGISANARPIAQGVGAGLGTTVGAAGGPAGMALGAGGGAMLAGQLYDAIAQTGRGNLVGKPEDIGRNTLQTLDTASQDFLTGAGASAVDQKVIAPLAQKVSNTFRARRMIAQASKMDQLEAASVARDAAGQALEAERQRIGQIFDEVERGGGATTLPRFREGILQHSQSEAAPIAGVPAALKRGAALTKPNPVALTKAIAEAMPDLDAEGVTALAQKIAEQGVPTNMAKELATHAPHALAVLSEGEAVPFGVARQAEKELSQLGGRSYLATPRQGVYRDLAGRIGEDLTDYLDEAAPAEATKLAEAKAAWADYKGTSKRLLTKFFGPDKFAMEESGQKPIEDALRVAFRPGAVSTTRDLQKLLRGPEYEQLVDAWLGNTYEQATVGGKFSQAKFSKLINAFDRNGHLDVILQPLVDSGVMPGGAEALRSAAKGPMLTRIAETAALRGLHGSPGAGISGAVLGTALSHPVIGGTLGVGVPLTGEALMSSAGRAGTQRGAELLMSPLTQDVLRRFLEQSAAGAASDALGSPR